MKTNELSVIDEMSNAADIVKKYFRTAAIFKKYDIAYCCGGKWPLKLVFETRELDPDKVIRELNEAARVVNLPASLPYHDWKINFLTDYIINIHHHYLRRSLPAIREQLHHFVEDHKKQFPKLAEVEEQFNLLEQKMVPHLDLEEDIIFPYIRQIAHAYESKESYASLLVRTLRKPVEEVMLQEHEFTEEILGRFRELTDNYTPPEASCTSHRLSFSLLRELDEDLVQHLHLENEILFPRAIAMEKELLERQ